ncbi:MAG: NADPH:quinone reductase [bacterium]|nr:NADPH:quinone reductase [bacterium]
MKAVRVHQFGFEHPMQVDEVEEPVPGPGEILIRNRAIGAHPVDTAVRAAAHPFYKNFSPPYIPGIEAAGEVLAAGEGVEGFRKGDRVCGRAIGGAYAEVVRLGAMWTFHLPKSYGFAEGSGLVIQYLTAWNAVVIKARVSAGESVLVHGGAGGVGLASIQLARAMGCRVFATVSTPEKAEIAEKYGAEAVINYREENFSARCMELTGGRGVDVVLALAAEATLNRDVEALAVGGRIIVVGTARALDPDACFAVQKALLRDAQIICLSMPNLLPKMPEVRRRLEPMLEAGTLRMHVEREMPLAEANAAHDILWTGSFSGRVVLIP